eukprot:54726-Eustigmatos_ZCMA.PRE.2
MPTPKAKTHLVVQAMQHWEGREVGEAQIRETDATEAVQRAPGFGVIGKHLERQIIVRTLDAVQPIVRQDRHVVTEQHHEVLLRKRQDTQASVANL